MACGAVGAILEPQQRGRERRHLGTAKIATDTQDSSDLAVDLRLGTP
jgi:hypothetical protein